MVNKTIDMPNGMMEAIYHKSSIAEFQGNPLIEALPPYFQAADIVDKFGRYPKISDVERLLPHADRIVMISRLNNYLELLPSHFDVIEKVNLIIRTGYVHRNPLNDCYKRNRVQFYRQSMAGKICRITDAGPSTSSSFALIGTSGVGKTTTIDQILSFVPQVLLHREYHFTQVAWVKLDCPMDGSLKQLLLAFLEKLDNLLDSSYVKQVGTKRTNDELTMSVAKIAAMHNVGLLVIDEIQNLLDASGVGQNKMLNFFVTLANEVKIPVVTIGTPRALNLLEGTFREARRVGDHGTCIWDSLDNREWALFIRSLWRYQWTAKFTSLTEELADEMREQTQGIHALVVKLFQLVQMQAIRNNSECITRELISDVASDRFKLVRPILNALKKQDKRALINYQDLLVRGIKELSAEVETDAKMTLLEAGVKKRNQHSERLNAMDALMAMKFPGDKVEELVTDLFNLQPALSSEAAVRLILDAVAKNADIKDTGKSLAEVINNDKKLSPIEALTAAGVIEKRK